MTTPLVKDAMRLFLVLLPAMAAAFVVVRIAIRELVATEIAAVCLQTYYDVRDVSDTYELTYEPRHQKIGCLQRRDN